MSTPFQHVDTNQSTSHELPEVIPVEELDEPHGWIWSVVNALLFVGVTVMLLSVTVQIVSRLLGVSLPWTEELTRFVFTATTFLGLAAGFRVAAHPRVTFLVGKGPAWVRKASAHVYAAAGTAFFIILAYTAWTLTAQQIASGETSPALGAQMFLVTLPLVVSAVLAILAHIQTVYFSADMRRRIEQGDIIA